MTVADDEFPYDIEEWHLNYLPDKQRADFEAVVMDDTSVRRQATLRKVTYATVHRNVEKARERLKAIIEREQRWERKRESEKFCSVCHVPLPGTHTAAAALDHHLNEHPEESEALLDGVTVNIHCSQCGKTFDCPIDIYDNGLHVCGVCYSCRQENDALELVNRELTAHELLSDEYEVRIPK